MELKIGVKKTGAGHYDVLVWQGSDYIGEFETTDMQLIDDISELDNGFEEELVDFDSFSELKNYVLSKVNDEKFDEAKERGLDGFDENKERGYDDISKESYKVGGQISDEDRKALQAVIDSPDMPEFAKEGARKKLGKVKEVCKTKEVKEVVKSESKKKEEAKKPTPKSKSTPAPPKAKKRTVMSVASEIRQDGETWTQAVARAGKWMKGDKIEFKKLSKKKTVTRKKKVAVTSKKKTVKRVSKKDESKKKKSYKRRKGAGNAKGGQNKVTNNKSRREADSRSVKRDRGRVAKQVGKRTSKSGKTYYEYRENRSDIDTKKGI